MPCSFAVAGLVAFRHRRRRPVNAGAAFRVRTLVALVVFGIAAQLAAAALFIWLRKPLASQKAD